MAEKPPCFPCALSLTPPPEASVPPPCSYADASGQAGSKGSIDGTT